MPVTRYLWDKYYSDLAVEIRTRFEELCSKQCVEPDKQLKKNALMNASVPRGKSAKQGGGVATTVTPTLEKMAL